MSVYNAKEAIQFFKTFGFRVDEELVNEWVAENNRNVSLTGETRQMLEADLYCFNEWCLIKGTAFEEGIDDKTKITRLLEEVSELRKEIQSLKDESWQLKELLGKNNFF